MQTGIKDRVDSWIVVNQRPVKVDIAYPQTVYTGFKHSLQQEFTFLKFTTGGGGGGGGGGGEGVYGPGSINIRVTIA